MILTADLIVSVPKPILARNILDNSRAGYEIGTCPVLVVLNSITFHPTSSVKRLAAKPSGSGGQTIPAGLLRHDMHI